MATEVGCGRRQAVGEGEGGGETDGAGDGAAVSDSTPSTVTLVRLVVPALAVISASSVPLMTACAMTASRLEKGSSPLAAVALSTVTRGSDRDARGLQATSMLEIGQAHSGLHVEQAVAHRFRDRAVEAGCVADA